MGPSRPKRDAPIRPDALSADKAAAVIVDAVRDDRFYVFTRPEDQKASLQRRIDGIMEDGAPRGYVASAATPSSDDAS